MEDPIENKSEYAALVYEKIKEAGWAVKTKHLPDSELSRSTEWRVLKELEESGLIEQKRKGFWGTP